MRSYGSQRGAQSRTLDAARRRYDFPSAWRLTSCPSPTHSTFPRNHLSAIHPILEMPLFNCDTAGCGKGAVRNKSCLLCRRHLCAQHLQPDHHRCPDWQNDSEVEAWEHANACATHDEVNSLVAAINVGALECTASLLRAGVHCTAVVPAYSPDTVHEVMGGMNFHITLRFSDGVEWICRIRRNNASSPPQEVQNAILLSEVATLKFLASTKVPVPAVHGYATFGDGNPVGVGYILMDKLKGRPLDLDSANEEQKYRFMVQFVDIFVELAAHPFPAIGSLTLSPSAAGGASIGPIVAESAIRTIGDKIVFGGPFTTAEDYRRHALELVLELIRQEELYVDTPLDAYLIHRFLLDQMSLIVSADSVGGTAGFYLRHMDDKGDHVLVDDDFNIVGIIDWERAQTVPKAEAFAAPLFMLDVGAYYSGNNDPSDIERLLVEALETKEHTEVATLVRSGRIQHRLAHCINGAIDDPSFADIFEALIRLLCEDEVGHWEAWRAGALTRATNSLISRTSQVV